MILNNVILSAYFNTRKDPQRDVFWKGNDYGKISGWYQSVKRFSLDAVIFHDHCSKAFIRKYSTDRITFQYYKPEENLLNARLRCFHAWLTENEVDKVFCLDISDIVLYHNPFNLIVEDKIYCGSEEMKIAKSGYVVNDFKDSYGKIYYPDNKILNCGILGGYYDKVLFVLGKMVKEFDKFRTEKNIDMAVFNKVMYDNFRMDEIITGKPLHTEFHKKETDTIARKQCSIKHK
jgi:hypothetical protein